VITPRRRRLITPAYQGAFVVVSHGDRFLQEIDVTRWIRPANGNPTETGAPEH
jgi:hypothetical protein